MTITFASASVAVDDQVGPPKITEWTAPMQAQANIAFSLRDHRHVDNSAVAASGHRALAGTPARPLHLLERVSIGRVMRRAHRLALPVTTPLSPRPASTWRSRQTAGDVELAAARPGEGQVPRRARVEVLVDQLQAWRQNAS
ncbi:MAG: hypothetical protein R2699_02475 [Acidimicrobiales bacterium]